MFLFRVLLLFLYRSAKLCQGDIVSQSQSRGQGWSLLMYQERSVSLLEEDLEEELVEDQVALEELGDLEEPVD